MRHAKKLDPIQDKSIVSPVYACEILKNEVSRATFAESKGAIQMGLACLRRLLIPQKVMYYKNPYGVSYRDQYTCPACGRRLRNNQPDPHCPACGQLLDWDIF